LDSGAQDKFALVTGGNRRIGKAVAWQLVKEDVGRNRLQAYERSGREVITARVITDVLHSLSPNERAWQRGGTGCLAPKFPRRLARLRLWEDL
jgi:hypothetical protein